MTDNLTPQDEEAIRRGCHKAHGFFLWLGEQRMDEECKTALLLDGILACLCNHEVMAARLRAALESNDAALIRQTAQQWIDLELLEKKPEEVASAPPDR